MVVPSIYFALRRQFVRRFEASVNANSKNGTIVAYDALELLI